MRTMMAITMMIALDNLLTFHDDLTGTSTAPRCPNSITSRPAPADDNRIKDASED